MIDAIAIANYFVEKSKKDKQSEKLTLLRLVKYVYIAYGFALVLLGRSIIMIDLIKLKHGGMVQSFLVYIIHSNILKTKL